MFKSGEQQISLKACGYIIGESVSLTIGKFKVSVSLDCKEKGEI
jgi:hypothetical protein